MTMDDALDIEWALANAQARDLIARSWITESDYGWLQSISYMALCLMEEHGLRPGERGGWTFQWSRAERAHAGGCRHDLRQLSFSAPLFAGSTEEQCKDTILHEIGHALRPAGEDHSRAWFEIARAIGCSGKRCFTEEDHPRVISVHEPAMKFDFIGSCPAGCGFEWRRRLARKPSNSGKSGTKYSCPRCHRGGYSESFRLVWRDA